VSRTSIENEQRLGGFAVTGVEKIELAMPVNRISFPVEATLGAHDPVLTHILIVRSGAEKDIEFGSVLRRYSAGGRRSGEPSTAGITRKPDMRCSIDVGLSRESDIEVKRRIIDFDIPDLKKIRKGLRDGGLEFGRCFLLVPLDTSVTAAHRSGERRSGK